MKRSLLTGFLFLCIFQLLAADYYWVGGGSNWSNINNWRLGSPTGGTPGIVPAAGDNVFFGSYSGFGTTAAARTVTLDANAFCANMTWESDVPNNPILARGGSNTLFVYGNLVLAPTVTYSNVVNVEFAGANPSTLTANGPINAVLNLTVNKPGSGLTLMDDLIYTVGGTILNEYGLTLTAGYLDASDKNVAVYSFWSENSNPRHFDITGGRLSVLRNFYFRGTNKTITAAASYVQVGIRLVTDGGEFDEVEAMSDSPNNDLFSVYNTTFRKLVFSNPSPSSNARLHAGNTVDSLIFMGQGVVRAGNNTIKHLSIAGNATIGGANNMIQYAEIGGTTDFIENGGHVIDTLLTAPNKNIYVTRTITINKYFRAGGEPCDGFTEITGYSAGTIHFADGAEIEIDNVLLTGLSATGSMTPLTVNGIDNEGNNGFIFNTPLATTRTLYWVGGAGDWNDRSHWSESSGGSGGACIPFIGDNVVFDGNSGLNTGGTVATSGNTYCHDMTWAASITGNPVFAVNGNFLMQVYGSLAMHPDVTMNARLDMRGAEEVTVETNGNQVGNNRILVRKEAAGGVTLLDDWDNPSGIFQLNGGYLDMAGRTVDINIFTSNTHGSRYVNMQDADITVNRWEYRGNNKTLDADNSHLSIGTSVYMANVLLQYDVVEISSGSLNEDNFLIDSAGFRKLTFSNPSLTTVARIGANNVIERLEFKGQGAIAGTGNMIDSVITGENRNFWLGSATTNTINEYFKAVHPDCSGLGEIRSLGSSSTVVFGADAEVEIANVYMENIVATGGGGTRTLPITFSGADAGGNAGWNIVASDGDARYWIGGAGDWNDASHWSTTSGGPGGACVPTVANDVYFDANSGFGTSAAARTVTINNGNAYFRNMSWAGVTNNPILNKAEAWNMEAWGESVVLNPATTLNAIIQFRGPEETTITGQALGNLDFELRKPGGRLVIGNDFNNNQTDILLYEGSLAANDVVLNLRSVDNDGRDNNISVDIAGSTIQTASHWLYNGGTSNRSLNAAGSTITAHQFLADGFAYDQVSISGYWTQHSAFSGIEASKVVFTYTNIASDIGINGTNNQLDTVEFKGGGKIYGTNNTIGTLIFFPGSRYVFSAGTNTIITDDWFGSGTPCRLTEIVSSSTSATATVTKASGAADFDYVRLQRMAAIGGAEFTAGTHSNDLGGNTGWDIAPYDGASPIEGLGPDISLSDAEFPYTISTAGFFGSPLSQYEWSKDGVVIGTGDELVVTEPGEYSIKVDFPDGCTITDEIVISLDVADLVTVKTLKEATQASYVPGEEVVYTITITNNGPDDAVDVSVIDEAPEGTAISGWIATVTSGTVDLTNESGTGNLSETIPLLPNGAVVIYEVTLATGSGRTADLSNTVEVTSVTPDPEPGCDACITLPLPAAPIAAISVTKELADVAQQAYIPGEDVVYTITVTNNGPSDAREVIVEDAAPAGATIGSWTATVTAGEVTLPGTSGTDALNETIAVLPSGAAVSYEVTVQTSDAVADDLVNTATVTSDTDDPDEADNTAITVGLPAVPDAPVSGGDQEECAESPVQTLTATATVPAGITIVWYDAATGGNVVPAPTLNAIGTITYYAQAQRGPLASLSRTAVTLTINELPDVVITDPAIACVGTTIDLTALAVTAGSDAGLTYTYHTDAAGMVALDNPDAVAVSGTYYIKGTNPETGCSVTMPVTVQFVDRPVVTVTHPDCAPGATGSITITEPLGAGFEYSINGVDYQSDPVFEDVAPGTYQVTAQHVSVPGCVSDPMEVTINAVPTTVTPTLVQPDCDNPLGQIIFPNDPDYEYAVYQTGGTPIYQSSPVFTDLAPGEYLVQMQSEDCVADPIVVTIDEAPEVPVAPVSDGDQEECATAPIQTLTATATVPAGVTITWFDQATGGSVVSSPILNTIGTVTYYAEAGNGDCVSTARTPVTLTINAQPIIDLLEDQLICGSFTLPSITGTDLSGDMAYYTESGGNGTRYEIGATISIAGAYTLYQYVVPADGCIAESEFMLTINETPDAGAIGADQSICYGEIPAELASVTAGTGTGTVAYRWEVSADGTAWSVVTGATEATYQPGELTATTHYRRITIATANGLTCESAPTDAVVITVAGELIADAGEDQEQYNSGEFTLDASASGGTGAWIVVSGTPLEPVSDSNDPNATITLEANSSVTLQWMVSGTACSVSDEVVLTYTVQADLVTVKTARIGGQTTYTAGEAVDYIITVRNYGPSDAQNVTINDTAPLGTTITSWSASVLGGTVTLPATSGSGDLDQTIAVLPNGATVLYEVSVQTPSDFTDPLVNVVEVGSDTADPEPTCTGCETVPMLAGDAQADIITVKELADVSQALYVPGTEVVYTITVTNDGPSDASGVTVTDIAPAGTTIAGWAANVTAGTATLPNTSGTGDLNETITYLPNGAAVTYTVTVQTPSDFTEDLINTVTVASATTDPDLECTGCSTVPLPAGDLLADLETVKVLSEAGQTAFAPGESVEYRITVVNHGPSDAADVNIQDTAPAGTTITGWTAEVTTGTATLPNASGTGNLNEMITLLPNGAEVTYTVTVQTPSDFDDDLVNTVTVTSPTDDPNPGCTNCTTTPLPAAPQADIEMVKVTSDAGQTQFTPGESVAYIITVTNRGPSDATNVTIQDTAPAGTTITGWTAEVIAGVVTLPNASGTGDLNETLLALPNGAVVTYQVTVSTTNETTADLVNTGEVSSDTDDPDLANNTATTPALPAIPAAPVSGGDQEVCVADPVQVLTATATVPDGVTIVWYDAPSGGSVVTNPILDIIGTVTYYAEAVKGALVSESRTAVTLTISELPDLVITDPAVACVGTVVDLTAPAITAGSDAGLTYTYYTDAAGTSDLDGPDAITVSGIYYIRATNPVTGCSTMAPVSVQFVDRPMVTVTHPDCVSGTGSITVTGPLGTGFEYSINGVDYQSDPLFEGVAPGTYSVTAQHVSVPGCMSEEVEVAINMTPTTATPTVAHPGCGEATGTIEFPADADYEYAVYQSGGTPVYQPSPVFADLAPGEYLVRMRSLVTDCEADPVTVTIDEAPEIPAAPTSGGNQEVCADNPVQTLAATATVPTGVNVVWYDATTGGNVVVDPILDAVGTITYYAEASNGDCVSETRTAVTLTINELPKLVITDPAVACVGTVVDLTAPAITIGSDADLTYTYYTDAAGTSDLDGPDAITVSGIYYIRATNPVTGCSTMAPVRVQFVDRPVVTVTHPDCVSGTGSITVTGPLGTGFEYSINGVDYQSDPLFEGVAPGTYSVTAQHVSVPGCVSEEVEVAINMTPTTATPTVAHPGCGEATGTIEFPADADYEYAVYQSGDTPVYQPSPVFADLAPGEYLVRMRSLVTDCEADPVTVTIDEAPEIPAAPTSGGNQEVCADNPVQALTATATVPAAVNVVWYDAPTGGNVVTSPILETTGTVTYYAEASNGDCVSETRTPVTLTIHALPTTATPTVAHPGCGEATGTIEFPADADYEYAVYQSGGTPVYQPSPVFADLAPGEYLVRMRSLVIDCEADPVTVTIDEAPEIPAAPTSGGNQEVCADNPVQTLTATATVPTGVNVVWYDAPTGGNVVTSPILEATGTVTYYAEASNGDCVSETRTPVTLTLLDEPVADAGADQDQTNNPVFGLKANTPTDGEGTWTVVSGALAGAISDIHDPLATVSLAPGTTVTLRWTVSNGTCAVSDEVLLTHLASRIADLVITKKVNHETPLAGTTVVFTIEVVNAGPDDATGVKVLDKLPSGYTFVSDEASVGSYDEPSGVWTIGGLTNGAQATLQVTATINVEGEHLNHAEVRGNEEDPNADDNEATAAVMPVQPPQVVDDAAAGNSNKAVVIAILANDAELTYPIDVASVEIVTQPQHGTVSIGTDGTIAYVSDAGYVGEDRFSYRVKDSEGHWSDTAEVMVTVAANPLRIPNIFTPNGDGQNDRFEIIGIEGYDRAELVVFNRWGNEIYRHNNYDNSWGGGAIQEGTYYYMLTLHKGSGKQVEKGWVVLKKQ